MSTPAPARRLVSKELTILMAGYHDVDKKTGEPITLAQFVAKRLVELALGYAALEKDASGMLRNVRHEAEPWALKELLDRYEGKPTAIIADEEGRVVAVERVTDMLRDRVNAMAEKAKEVEAGLIQESDAG